MPELPHGWRVRNSNGEVKGPPPESDHSDSEDGSEFSDNGEPLDIRPDSPGWEDLEDDTETLNIQCLFCATTFPSAKAMLDHCTESHDFDFLDVQRQHKLDFYGAIKLVNYIRSEVKAGKEKPAVDDAKLWEDDKFLQPALADDALLFSLDDVIDVAAGAEEDGL
ncbi:hypothetical protein M409DRAFT_19857 [Zasmidium cellare ATCC 36951]|uniref:type I protein arginine methyltransferase n=1 Tax=Zasmidium cellare ATCC 36951 TaxID=1080233 RepID=A0A6A6CSX9_ZASCE|nr:uncharacterized protein M409DRAFT_19857 [Zasmidium cellare ATCC 36951]KAF2170254.1 hypothetical protein M409DRAFT_19857 [Zasmidium cellare ATCC 36951]